jgi:Protein of unknown function (DUF669).
MVRTAAPVQQTEEKTKMANDEPMGIIELEDSLADVEKPQEIPAGKYVAEIQDVQERTSANGNTYYAIQFRVAPDELPADVAEEYEDGALLFWNRLLKPRSRSDRRALFNLRKFIEAIGLDANTTSIDPNDWMGRSARLHVALGKYQGEDRAEIRAVEAAEAAAPARAAAKPASRRRAAAE